MTDFSRLKDELASAKAGYVGVKSSKPKLRIDAHKTAAEEDEEKSPAHKLKYQSSGFKRDLLASQKVVVNEALEKLTLWKCVFEGGVGVRTECNIQSARTGQVLKFDATVEISEIISADHTKYLNIAPNQEIGEGWLFSHQPNTGQQVIVCLGGLNESDPFANDGHSFLPVLPIQDLWKFCKKYDANRDDSLSKEELRLLLKDCGVPPSQLTTVLNGFWAWAVKHGAINASNNVIISQFLQDYILLAKAKALNEVRAKLSEADLDGDNLVSPEEFIAVLRTQLGQQLAESEAEVLFKPHRNKPVPKHVVLEWFEAKKHSMDWRQRDVVKNKFMDLCSMKHPLSGLLSEPALTNLFEYYDRNNSGGLSLEEIGLMARHLIEFLKVALVPVLKHRVSYMARIKTGTRGATLKTPAQIDKKVEAIIAQLDSWTPKDLATDMMFGASGKQHDKKADVLTREQEQIEFMSSLLETPEMQKAKLKRKLHGHPAAAASGEVSHADVSLDEPVQDAYLDCEKPDGLVDKSEFINHFPAVFFQKIVEKLRITKPIRTKSNALGGRQLEQMLVDHLRANGTYVDRSSQGLVEMLLQKD